MNKKYTLDSFLHNFKNREKHVGSTTTYLKAKYFEKAREISQKVTGERNQWKTYLNAIALLCFEDWLQELVPNIKFNINNASIFQPQHKTLLDAVCNIQISNFKLTLITIDNLAYSWITVPENIINSAELAAHLYVLLQVVEDEEEMIIHGFMYRDEILEYQESINEEGTREYCNCFKIPLLRFDKEINNLLIYSRFLEPNAITLPTETIINCALTPSIDKDSNVVVQSFINLSQWWSGVFEEDWQSLKEILTPQMLNRVYFRSNNLTEYPIERGKLFNFGSLLNEKGFVMIVKMKRKNNDHKGILVQIRPQNEYSLPQGLELKVTLNHNMNETESKSAIATNLTKLFS